jgi:hypothetical protein
MTRTLGRALARLARLAAACLVITIILVVADAVINHA